MNKKTLLRKFNLRTLLFVGMLWGGMPLITLPMVFRGPDDTSLILFSVVFNALTVLPASALAFWHRRIACIWMSINAMVLVIAVADSIKTGRHLSPGSLAGICSSIALALSLDFIELGRWPAALGRE